MLVATGTGGTGIYTYQWYSTGGMISGATASTYSPGQLTSTTGYYCEITSGFCGMQTTPTTTITVYGNMVATISGGYFYQCQLARPTREAQDDEAAARLWSGTAKRAGL